MDMTEQERDEADRRWVNATTRECPQCGAPGGSPCVTLRGNAMQTVHYDREELVVPDRIERDEKIDALAALLYGRMQEAIPAHDRDLPWAEISEDAREPYVIGAASALLKIETDDGLFCLFCQACPSDVERNPEWEFTACIGGHVYGPCNQGTCGGVCEHKHECPCRCHWTHTRIEKPQRTIPAKVGPRQMEQEALATAMKRIVALEAQVEERGRAALAALDTAAYYKTLLGRDEEQEN